MNASIPAECPSNSKAKHQSHAAADGDLRAQKIAHAGGPVGWLFGPSGRIHIKVPYMLILVLPCVVVGMSLQMEGIPDVA